jgi:hypothetical protein
MTLIAGVLRRDALGRIATVLPGAGMFFNGGTPVGPMGDLQVSTDGGVPSGVPAPTREFNLLAGPIDPAVTVVRTSTATYFNAAGALADAAADTPRFDHNPATLEPRGLRIESARTNLALNNAVGVTQNVAVTAVAHTLSFVGTGSVALSGAAVGNLVGTGPGFADRVALTFTPAAGSLTLTVTGSVQWLQVEAGAFASSIIKTAGAAVTRNQDNLALLGASFSAFWNVAEGTVQAIGTSNSVTAGQFPRLFTAQDNVAANVVGVSRFVDQNAARSSVITASVAQAAFNLGPMPAGVRVNTTLAYKVNDFAGSADGGAAVVDTAGTVPVVDRLYFGSVSGTSSLLDGWLEHLRYWNTRLPNAQLAAVSSGAGPFFNGGLLYSADGSLVVANGGAIANYVQGGLPVTAAGALCVAYGGVPVTFQAGIPFDAAGRVCMVAPVPPVELEAFDISFEDPAFG